VAQDLVDDSLVKAALAAVGGPAAFRLPENLTRKETIAL
jgi:NitT/TauT family transport system substrate-binding protein